MRRNFEVRIKDDASAKETWPVQFQPMVSVSNSVPYNLSVPYAAYVHIAKTPSKTKLSITILHFCTNKKMHTKSKLYMTGSGYRMKFTLDIVESYALSPMSMIT